MSLTPPSKASSHISHDVIAQDFLLQEQEKNIKKDIQETEETKKSQILRWADILRKRIELGTIHININQISSHIKKEMRSMGFTEGQICYLKDFMPPEYVNENLSREQQQQNGGVYPAAADYENSLYYRRYLLSQKFRNEFHKLSQAEKLELVIEMMEVGKELKNTMAGDQKDGIERCNEEGISIPSLEKTSADGAPERFHGQSALCDELELNFKMYQELADEFKEAYKIAYEFRPDKPGIAEEAAAHFKNHRENIGKPATVFNWFYVLGAREIFANLNDGKYGAPAKDWVKIGYDKYNSCGSHGSGKTNAVYTGIHAMKLGKDLKSIIITPVKREFTREIVGDRAKEDLLKKAFDYLNLQSIEEGIQTWTKNTTFEEIVKDPNDFYNEEINKKYQEIILKGGNGNKQ